MARRIRMIAHDPSVGLLSPKTRLSGWLDRG
jgi:hypothetical protein